MSFAYREMATTGLLDAVENGAAVTLKNLDVDDELALDIARRDFHSSRRYVDQVVSAAIWQERYEDISAGMDDRKLALGVLASAALLPQRDTARTLLGLSSSIEGMYEASRIGHNPGVGKLRATLTSDAVHQWPLKTFVYNTLGIDGSHAIPKHDAKYALATVVDTISWDVYTLAELVQRHGKAGLHRLRDDYGIKRYGRYPIDLLSNQLDQPIGPHEHEFPVYVARYDTNAALWQDSLYDNVTQAAQRTSAPIVPRIYEFGTNNQLFSQMANATRPAFGVISAHGDGSGLSTRRREDLDATRKALTMLEPSQAQAIHARWARAGGIVMLTCEIASDRKFIPLPTRFASEFGMPVMGSIDEVSQTAFSIRKRLGRTTLHASLSSRDGKILIAQPDSQPSDRQFIMAHKPLAE